MFVMGHYVATPMRTTQRYSDEFKYEVVAQARQAHVSNCVAGCRHDLCQTVTELPIFTKSNLTLIEIKG